MEQHRRGATRGQFSRVGVPRCRRSPVSRHVENTLHYTRDVTFQEDHSRIRNKPGVFARLRSFAYNILRPISPKRSQHRFAAALAGANALLNGTSVESVEQPWRIRLLKWLISVGGW